MKWAPGTTMCPTIIHVAVDDQQHAKHVGVSYDVYLPDGTFVVSSAYTWPVPDAQAAQINALLDNLLHDAETAEDGAVLGPHPQPGVRPVVSPSGILPSAG